MLSRVFLIALFTLNATNLYADTRHVTVISTQLQTQLGTVDFKDTPNGLLITPNLSGLPSGMHGFHIHQHANCENHGTDAGGHYDPAQTNSHQGPYRAGHLGDLPALFVNEKGKANLPILAPHLKTTDLNKRTLMIHAGSDTYRDTPPLGGGGERIACGVIL